MSQQYKTVKIRKTSPEPPERPAEGRLDYEDHLIDLIDEVAAFKALRPEIRKALQEKDIKSMLKESSVWAMAQMVNLANNANSEAVKKEALKDILDRAGWKAPDKSVIIDASELTDSELDAKLMSKMKELGVDNEGPTKEAPEGTEGRSPGSPGTEEQEPTEE